MCVCACMCVYVRACLCLHVCLQQVLKFCCIFVYLFVCNVLCAHNSHVTVNISRVTTRYCYLIQNSQAVKKSVRPSKRLW